MDHSRALIALLTGAAVFGVALADDAARTPASAALSGAILDAKGKPIAGAAVSVEGGGSSKTAADGTWSVAGVAPGDVLVTAQSPGRFRVQTMLHVAAGETRSWDATIGVRGKISGHVVDEYGHPLSGVAPPYGGWSVWAMPEPGWMRRSMDGNWGTPLDANGAFELWRSPGVMYRLRVSPPNSWSRALVTEPMSPGLADVTLRVPPSITPHARVLCRLEAPNGTALAGEVKTGAAIFLLERDGAVSGPVDFDATEHRWISRRVAPGTYSVVAFHPVWGQFEFPSVVVKDAADVDIGTLRYPPCGRIHATPARSGPGSDAVANLCVRRLFSIDDLDADWHALWMIAKYVELRGDVSVDVDVAPGRYVGVVHLRRGNEDIEAVEIPFDVRSGETTNVTVPLHGAPKRRIHLRYPGLRPARVMVTASDPAGNVEGREVVTGEADILMNLVPGRHELVVATTDWRRLTAALDIPAENAPEVFDVVLR